MTSLGQKTWPPKFVRRMKDQMDGFAHKHSTREASLGPDRAAGLLATMFGGWKSTYRTEPRGQTGQVARGRERSQQTWRPRSEATGDQTHPQPPGAGERTGTCVASTPGQFGPRTQPAWGNCA